MKINVVGPYSPRRLLENLVNKIPEVNESMVYAKQD